MYTYRQVEGRGKAPERKGKTMSKFEVWVTKWSEEYKAQIKVVAGVFDQFFNARLFADAYREHFKASTEIIEYRQVKQVADNEQ